MDEAACEAIMSYGQRSGPPSWFVILLGVAIVFGLYYLWFGLRNYMSTGLSVAESTQQAIVRNTATAVRILEFELNAPTPLPSLTPIPACQKFAVHVREAIVRSEPSIGSRIVEALKEGATVCVIAALPNTDWYLIDENPLTRRLDKVYMHRDIIYALNPTPRPTDTLTPTQTDTATQTFTPRPRLTQARAPAKVISRPPSATAAFTPSPSPPSISL